MQDNYTPLEREFGGRGSWLLPSWRLIPDLRGQLASHMCFSPNMLIVASCFAPSWLIVVFRSVPRCREVQQKKVPGVPGSAALDCRL